MNELVLFGVTGDLAKQKLIPALYNLYRTGKIDKKSSFIGFGRKNFSKSEFQTFIEEVLNSNAKLIKNSVGTKNTVNDVNHDVNDVRNFSAQWSYVESELNDTAGYKKLVSMLTTSQTTFYISLPPMYQYLVCNMLISVGVVSKSSAKDSQNDMGRKIALEKPYGFDTESSKKLDAYLTKKLQPNQILRVDHYAGKQALVELEAVAKQGVLKTMLSNQTIKKIEVQLNESIDVSNRGSFYDSVGALSDIGQNHVLHMLATILAIPEYGQALERTNSSISPMPILAKLRGQAISLLEIQKKVKHAVILGQYNTFRNTAGVKADSITETFFNIFANIKQTKGANQALSKRWHGTLIELIGGKALNKAEASITLYPKTTANKKSKNPEPIKILVNGYGEREAYEQIFIDIFEYNPNRFVDFEQVVSGWNFIEKIKRATSKDRRKRMCVYKKGSYPQDILPA